MKINRLCIVKVRLTEPELEDLDRISRSLGKTKSYVVRDALKQYSKKFWRYSDAYLEAEPGALEYHYD